MAGPDRRVQLSIYRCVRNIHNPNPVDNVAESRAYVMRYSRLSRSEHRLTCHQHRYPLFEPRNDDICKHPIFGTKKFGLVHFTLLYFIDDLDQVLPHLDRN
jgi:hypothetical protein